MDKGRVAKAGKSALTPAAPGGMTMPTDIKALEFPHQYDQDDARARALRLLLTYSDDGRAR